MKQINHPFQHTTVRVHSKCVQLVTCFIIGVMFSILYQFNHFSLNKLPLRSPISVVASVSITLEERGPSCTRVGERFVQ